MSCLVDQVWICVILVLVMMCGGASTVESEIYLFMAFGILFYMWTHLARGYSSGEPRNHCIYVHTYSYIQHNH